MLHPAILGAIRLLLTVSGAIFALLMVFTLIGAVLIHLNGGVA